VFRLRERKFGYALCKSKLMAVTPRHDPNLIAEAGGPAGLQLSEDLESQLRGGLNVKIIIDCYAKRELIASGTLCRWRLRCFGSLKIKAQFRNDVT
jgi:hypothetical protein